MADAYSNDLVPLTNIDGTTNIRDALQWRKYGPYLLDCADGRKNFKRAFLGSGASADVYRVFDPRDGRRYAAKFFRNNISSSWDTHIFMEAEMLLRGKEVLPELFGSFEVCDGVWLVLVMSLLKPLPADAKYAAGMRRCLKEFHAAGFGHGDIHENNFMVDPTTDTVRMIDFGLSYNYGKPESWFIPKIPRGKRYRTLGDWKWLASRFDLKSMDSVRNADFLVDTTKLEATIDLFFI